MSTSDTTDVQRVIATLMKNMHNIQVKCDFIPGSDAQGCMVVLMGKFGNITMNITQNSSWLFKVTNPYSCYHGVLGYDIEPDGSIGTLAVSGVFIQHNTSSAPCLHSTNVLGE